MSNSDSCLKQFNIVALKVHYQNEGNFAPYYFVILYSVFNIKTTYLVIISLLSCWHWKSMIGQYKL